jgi:PAS domain S-box-containing protein
LVLQSDDIIFPARFDVATEGNSVKRLKAGSLLQVSGVCLIDADKDQEPRSFRLLLSSPDGVRVLAQPTWWNLEHTLATFGLMMLLVFAALAWVVSLRYRVREQTEIIRRKLEHQTVLEERFKDLVEHAVEGIFRIAPDGRYAAVNKALARMLGYESRAEVMNNRNHSDCQNYVASDRQVEFVRLLDERGSVERFEYQARRKDGSVIWVSENARAVRCPSGELLYYEGTVVDITERKRAEEALRKNKEQFEAFMDHNPAVAFLKDEEGRYLYANRAWERQFPTERSDWTGKTDYDFWPAETAKLFRESDLAALAMDHSLEKLESAYDAKGSLRYWMVFKFAIKTAEGRRAVGGLALDVTDRQQAEESLRQSDERFSKAFRASPIPICISTLKEGRYLDVNDSFLQLLGFIREEVIGHTSLGLGVWAEPPISPRWCSASSRNIFAIPR